MNKEDYVEFLGKLHTEIGYFFSLAQKSENKPYSGLKARKQSKLIEKMLLEFRKMSREIDKLNKKEKKEKNNGK